MRLLLLSAAALTIGAMMQPASAMSVYKWKFRPLVVFAVSETDARLVEQRAIVAAGRSGLADRDMVVVWVIGDAVSAELGPSPGQSAAVLRARYGIPPGTFRAVLVGKDGGGKLSSARPLGRDALFATIDAMPMRRDEIRRRQ